MRKNGLNLTVVRNESTGNWDATFPDFSTRTFDGRFDESTAWTKARRWYLGLDGWMAGLYQEAV